MIIYTDGACKENKKNSGRGGWAYIALEQVPGKDMKVLAKNSGGKFGTTNQEMEIIAAAEALEFASTRDSETITLYSDSAYVINCMKDGWYLKWRKNGWKNSKKNPVENREAWERLVDVAERLPVTFYHVNRNSARFIQEVDSLAKFESRRQEPA
jgi:ribonuclease HI